MPLDQFFRILRARWVLVTSIIAAVSLTALLVSLVLPKNYTATATLMVDIKPDPVGGFSPAALPGQFVSTQVDLIKSPLVASRVVRGMKLTSLPSMRQRWEQDADGKGDFETWVAELISKGLDVRPAKDSSLISISYDGTDPQFAASMANAFARSFMDSTVQLRVDPAKQYAGFFEERATLAREKLEQAQAKLSEAQQANGIVLTDERLDNETGRLNDLSTQVVQLSAIRSETDSRNTQARKNPEHVQDVVTSSLIGGLKTQLALQEAKFTELSSQYGERHPNIIEIKANIDNLRERIRTETGKIAAGVNTSATINTTRLDEAKSAFDAQRERVLKLKGERAKLQLLEREVDNAQRLYDSIQTRLSQVNLESNSSQSNIYLVSGATMPNKPTSPKVLLNVALALVFGTFFAVMIALGVETLDRRVRGALDIVQLLELPVIGTLPSPLAKPRSRLNFMAAPHSSELLASQSSTKSIEAS
jgi:succinoglycan biosynthesis transport protein ExoP